LGQSDIRCVVTSSDIGVVTCESSNINPHLMEASLVEPAELVKGLVTLEEGGIE
jgi:hypothetical protein